MTDTKLKEYVPIIILHTDDDGNALIKYKIPNTTEPEPEEAREEAREYAIMQPSGAVGPARFSTFKSAQNECQALNRLRRP